MKGVRSSQAQIGSPASLADATRLHDTMHAAFEAVRNAVVATQANLALHRNWNAIDRALSTQQFNSGAQAAVARLHEHVGRLAGVRDAEGMAPVAAYFSGETVANLGLPDAVRIGDDEFVLLRFEDETHTSNVGNDGQVLHVPSVPGAEK